MDFVGDEDAVRYAIQHALGENDDEQVSLERTDGFRRWVALPSAKIARDFLAELQRRGFEVKKIERPEIIDWSKIKMIEPAPTTTDAEELLAAIRGTCPFCVGSKFGFDVSNCGEKKTHVECLGCGARGPGVGRSEVESGDWDDADAEAVRRWNYVRH